MTDHSEAIRQLNAFQNTLDQYFGKAFRNEYWDAVGELSSIEEIINGVESTRAKPETARQPITITPVVSYELFSELRDTGKAEGGIYYAIEDDGTFAYSDDGEGFCWYNTIIEALKEHG